MKNKKSFRKNIPNIITSLRFVGTIGILLLPPLKLFYFIVYTLTGITDVLDGFISRKMNLTSDFGARLDSIADLFFYAVSIIILLPILVEKLPYYIWIFVAVILTVRICSYIVSAIRFHRFATHHTYLNKITGVFVFAVPYSLITDYYVAFCITVCVIGFLSSLEDLLIHIIFAEYNDSIKTVLPLNR